MRFIKRALFNSLDLVYSSAQMIRCFIFFLFVTGCLQNSAAAERLIIEKIFLSQTASVTRSASEIDSGRDVKNLTAYRWSLGKRNGVLITAVLTSGANECVVVSVKKGEWRIIGSSPLRHPCFWSELPPVIDQGAGQYEIKFMSQQDYISTGVQFTPSSVDLNYVKKNADFCMLDMFGPGCVKY